jgi:predicted nucleic acid-binding protein
MIRTFIDSGVLIQSVRGEESLSNKALEILADTNREFASSIFLKIEILPKAIYNKQSREVKFYQEYFDSVTYWAMDINQIILNAYREASQYGLGAMDALHIASAVSLNATEFITSEKSSKSIHRTPSIKIISIHNL